MRWTILCVLGALACDREQAAAPNPSVSTSVSTIEAPVTLAAAKPPPPPPWATRTTPDSGFPCDVERVLATSCRRCHWNPQENDAPFPIAKYEDVQEVRSDKPIHVLMKQMLEADLMPPLDALVEPAVTPLEPDDKNTLLQWLEGGARRSSSPCPVAGTPSPSSGSD